MDDWTPLDDLMPFDEWTPLQRDVLLKGSLLVVVRSHDGSPRVGEEVPVLAAALRRKEPQLALARPLVAQEGEHPGRVGGGVPLFLGHCRTLQSLARTRGEGRPRLFR